MYIIIRPGKQNGPFDPTDIIRNQSDEARDFEQPKMDSYSPLADFSLPQASYGGGTATPMKQSLSYDSGYRSFEGDVMSDGDNGDYSDYRYHENASQYGHSQDGSYTPIHHHDGMLGTSHAGGVYEAHYVPSSTTSMGLMSLAAVDQAYQPAVHEQMYSSYVSGTGDASVPRGFDGDMSNIVPVDMASMGDPYSIGLEHVGAFARQAQPSSYHKAHGDQSVLQGSFDDAGNMPWARESELSRLPEDADVSTSMLEYHPASSAAIHWPGLYVLSHDTPHTPTKPDRGSKQADLAFTDARHLESKALTKAVIITRCSTSSTKSTWTT